MNDVRYEGCNSNCVRKCNKYIESKVPIDKYANNIEYQTVVTCNHWKTCDKI